MAELVNKSTPEGKGVRTFLQTVGGVIVAFLYGLWSLPGVPEYVHSFVQHQGLDLLVTLALLIGLPAGLIAYIQNRAGK